MFDDPLAVGCGGVRRQAAVMGGTPFFAGWGGTPFFAGCA